MAEEQVELAAKDVFVLLGVPVPENLDAAESKWQEQGDSKNDESEAPPTFDEDDDVHFNTLTEPPVIDVTPAEDLDYSSSDSMTKIEIEEKRWYNPALKTGLEKNDFNVLKTMLKTIKNTAPILTLAALSKLKEERLAEESYQNMFISLNGFEVLVNILECNNDDCVRESLVIMREMSELYGAQCALCKLNAVRPLLGVLLLKNKNVMIRFMAAETLLNVSKLRKGRKLIRLNGGIRVLVRIIDELRKIHSKTIALNKLSGVDKTKARLINCCCCTLTMLCKSLKSQEQLWSTGFVHELLPELFTTKHIEIQKSIMTLLAECCCPRPKVVNQKMDKLYKTALTDLNLLPQITKYMISDITELAINAADILLYVLEGDASVNSILLKHKGMDVIFKSIRKFETERQVMVSAMAVLWKSSVHKQCRKVMEKQGIANFLLELLSYKFDDRVIGYAVATLTELWASESLQGQLKQTAIPKYLELLDTCMHGLVLANVCTALARMSADPECMRMVDEGNGFRLIWVLLPSLSVDKFDKYQPFYGQETVIAAADCLTEIMKNTPPDVNNLNGMYDALCDVVDLLTYDDLDVLAATCRLIEKIAAFKDNLKIMIEAGVIGLVTKLATTEHTNLRASFCRALGKCCTGGDSTSRLMCCQNVIDHLWKYTQSKHQIVLDSVPMALSGLSEDPLNCVKIESFGFLPFLRQCMKSEKSETAMAAVNCMRNVRKTSAAIGQYKEQCG